MPVKNEKIRRIALATGMAISIEPTGWGVGKNVSRKNDHKDKKLQDYIIIGHMIQDALYELSPENLSMEKLFDKLFTLTKTITNTNTSFGSLTLLVPNILASIKTNNHDLRKISEKAYSLILTSSSEWFFEPLEKLSTSYIHPFSSSLMPSTTDRINKKWKISIREQSVIKYLRLIQFDPVSLEILNVFTTTRKKASYLSSKYGLSLPSEVLDEVFREYCCRFIDYLVYRKYGLDYAIKCKEFCCNTTLMEEEICSMGSISDLVVLTLYYHFYNTLSSI